MHRYQVDSEIHLQYEPEHPIRVPLPSMYTCQGRTTCSNHPQKLMVYSRHGYFYWMYWVLLRHPLGIFLSNSTRSLFHPYFYFITVPSEVLPSGRDISIPLIKSSFNPSWSAHQSRPLDAKLSNLHQNSLLVLIEQKWWEFCFVQSMNADCARPGC